MSTGDPDPIALRAAAEWIRDRIGDAGGACELIEVQGNPLVHGRLQCERRGAPTVLVYGHYDVEGVGDPALWTTPPFEPTIRNNRIYARGASDDKGNSWPLLWTALEMAKAGELDVNVRVLVEGEEEPGSASLLAWLSEDREEIDAAIAFDAGGPTTEPALALSARGLIIAVVEVRVAARDLHSGTYGGVAANAIHVLNRMLGTILPDSNGTLRNELHAGMDPVPDRESSRWRGLPPGAEVLKLAGTEPMFKDTMDDYYLKVNLEPSVDVNGIAAGDDRTIIPSTARAHVTMRLAPGQRHETIWRELERLLRQSAPPTCDVKVQMLSGSDAAAFDPESDVLRAARRAYTSTFGSEPLLYRLGGTLPLLDVLRRRGVQTVVGGFAHPADNIHAPDESYRLEALNLAARAARALLTELAALR